jgi:hypothetical protein
VRNSDKAGSTPSRPAGGFEWSGPHDRDRRTAELLLVAVATICAAYVATVVIAVVVAIHLGGLGPHHFVKAWERDLGPLGIAALGVAGVGALAAIIAVTASKSLAARVTRLAGARAPADGEAEHASTYIESFALGLGFPVPRVLVIDENTPNGFAVGRSRASAVCVTTGALRLPTDQLEALCAQTLTSLCNRALPLTCAAADLVILASWCTNAVWGTAAALITSTVIGVPVAFAATTTVAIVLLIAVTKPLLAIASRAIPKLRARSAQLADLDAVRVTNQPAGLARLLLTTAADTRRVASRWQIANLWFDADTSRPPARKLGRRLLPWMAELDPTDTGSARHRAEVVRRDLIDRARVLVDQSGDPKLRAQLEKVAGV